jgi:DNA-binding beta-propeller fold protein YncE
MKRIGRSLMVPDNGFRLRHAGGIISSITAILVGTLLPAPSAQASPILEYQTTLTLASEGAGLGLPVAVSVDPATGELCVTDGMASSVRLFNRRNMPVFSTGALAGLSDPQDITPDLSGGFACTDAIPGQGRTIRRLNLFGESVPFAPEKPGDRWFPDHLLVTRDGNYLTTDPDDGFLTKHDARTGALLWKKALVREESGEILGLGRPAEAPDGRLYLPIGGDRIVLVLSAEGDPLTSFGVTGTGRGRLAFPVGVAICPNGDVAVLDRMRNVVLLYAPDHTFLAEFGDYGAGPREFYQPVAIAAAPDGRVFVAQGFLARILVFRFFDSESGTNDVDRPQPDQAGVAGMSRLHSGGRGVPAIESPGSAPLGRSRLTETSTRILQDLQNGGC